jgi:hypothetical protein
MIVLIIESGGGRTLEKSRERERERENGSAASATENISMMRYG